MTVLTVTAVILCLIKALAAAPTPQGPLAGPASLSCTHWFLCHPAWSPSLKPGHCTWGFALCSALLTVRPLTLPRPRLLPLMLCPVVLAHWASAVWEGYGPEGSTCIRVLLSYTLPFTGNLPLFQFVLYSDSAFLTCGVVLGGGYLFPGSYICLSFVSSRGEIYASQSLPTPPHANIVLQLLLDVCLLDTIPLFLRPLTCFNWNPFLLFG